MISVLTNDEPINHKTPLNKKQECQPHYIEMGLNKARNIIKS